MIDLSDMAITEELLEFSRSRYFVAIRGICCLENSNAPEAEENFWLGMYLGDVMNVEEEYPAPELYLFRKEAEKKLFSNYFGFDFDQIKEW